jgi:hypothetical protein
MNSIRLVSAFSAMIVIVLASCNLGHREVMLDYFQCVNDGKQKVFEFKTDSTISKMLLNQKCLQINDSVWEFEFVFLRSDSLPMLKSKERHSVNNTHEFVQQSMYSRNSSNKVIEIKGKAAGDAKFFLDQPNQNIFYKCYFIIDSNLIMRIKYQFSFNYQVIDSLSEASPCLVIYSKESTYLDYLNNRKDTTIYTEGIRVFVKNKGVVLFGRFQKDKKELYKLKE